MNLSGSNLTAFLALESKAHGKPYDADMIAIQFAAKPEYSPAEAFAMLQEVWAHPVYRGRNQ